MKKKQIKFCFDENSSRLKLEDIKPSTVDLFEEIVKARNLALEKQIYANAVIIDKNHAFVEGFVFPHFFGQHEIPDMICGLKVKFDKLPECITYCVYEDKTKEEKTTNKTLQEQLDYRKWIESERAERDLSGSMDFCAGCKYAYGNKCTVTDASVRTRDELCAENYERITK